MTWVGHLSYDWIYNQDATCTKVGTQTRTCSDCGEKETILTHSTALGHQYETVITPATCITEGYTTYTCGNCGELLASGVLGYSIGAYCSSQANGTMADFAKATVVYGHLVKASFG